MLCAAVLPTMQAEMLSLARSAATEAGRYMVARSGADVTTTKLSARDLVTAVDEHCQEIVESRIAASYPSHRCLGEESVAPGIESAVAAAQELYASEWSWIIDPVDGTTNLVAGIPMSVVSIGIARHGVPLGAVVFDPYREELFEAWRGQGATLNGQPISVSRAEHLADAVVCAPCPHSPTSMPPALRSINAAVPRARSVRILGSGVLNLCWVACGRLSAYWEHELACWDTAAGTLLVQEAGGRVSDTDGTPFTLTTRSVLASNGATHDELRAMLASADAEGPESLPPSVDQRG
jgi:myo-inositol-1(or 4)-monophosphatase